MSIYFLNSLSEFPCLKYLTQSSKEIAELGLCELENLYAFFSCFFLFILEF